MVTLLCFRSLLAHDLDDVVQVVGTTALARALSGGIILRKNRKTAHSRIHRFDTITMIV